MTWDSVWEDIYNSKEWGIYPELEVVRFVARNFFSYENRDEVKVLDLGCGPGSNTWFLSEQGFNVTAVDGSATAVKKCKKLLKRKGLKAQVEVADFLNLPYSDKSFDLIIDCCSIQHNNFESINNIVSTCHSLLRPNGKMFSIMCNEDSSLQTNHGVIHFITLSEIEEVFKNFENVQIDHSTRTDHNRTLNEKKWHISASKINK